MAVTAIKTKNAVESLRDIVQDPLVPELKSLKMSIEGLRTEMQLRDEKQTLAILHLGDSLSQLSRKLDDTLDIRERLVALEAVSPKNR